MGLSEKRTRTYVLALDIGTSSVRARLFDERGVGLDPGPAATRRYAWDVGEGGMWISAPELLSHTLEVVDAAVARVREDGARVLAVAVAAFWHGLLGLDGADEPVTPVYAWGDQRGVDQALRFREEMDEGSVHARTGCFIHPSYPSVRLRWLAETRPDLYGRVAAWVSFPEYLEAYVFGRRRCSYSMASGTGLLDIHRLEWDAEWLDALRLDPSRLSPLVDAGEPLVGMVPELARRWPELADAEWHPALGDGGCANVGSGALGRANPGLTIGTSAAIRVVWEAAGVEVPAGIWCYRLDGRRFVAGSALSNGGNGIAFLRSLFSMEHGPGWTRSAERVAPDAHGLTILPFLLAERGPGWRTEREASIVGLTHETTEAEIVRAWMEAVAYRIAGAAGRLEAALGRADRVWASGGALHSSPFWAGIVADVLHRPVALPAEREATARGAALVSLEALGILPDLSDAPPPEVAEVVAPDPARHEVYAAAARRHEALEGAIRDWRYPT